MASLAQFFSMPAFTLEGRSAFVPNAIKLTASAIMAARSLGD
jgi:hypothetical protein